MAFRALYQRHTPAVYQFVLRLVGGNVPEAEDVVQETWMRAAKGLQGFRWKSALRSWVMGIALNRVRELARKKKRSLVEVDQEWELAAPSVDPGIPLDLNRALELLPPGFRTVLVLHDVEGFTHREIADAMGSSESSVQMLLHRAMTALKKDLASRRDK